MGGSTVLLLLLVALAGLLVWLCARSRSPATDGPHKDVENPAELEEAESELSELDAFATPEDADDQLPDWGPGTPKP